MLSPRGRHRSCAAALSLTIGLVLLSGCAPATPAASRKPAQPVAQPIRVVRTIEHAANPVARPGGGQLAYVDVSAYKWQPHMLPTWDATTSVALGRPVDPDDRSVSVSLTSDGLYRLDTTGIYFGRWGKPEKKLSAVGTVVDLWASPSGKQILRLHVNQHGGLASNTVKDSSSGRDIKLDLPAGAERISDVQWISDGKASVLCDPEDGPSTTYVLTLSSGSWRFSDPQAADGQACPALSPDGRFQVAESPDGRLVLIDERSGQRVGTWAPIGSRIQYGHGMSHIAWPDRTHIAVGVITDTDDAVVVLDVSDVVK